MCVYVCVFMCMSVFTCVSVHLCLCLCIFKYMCVYVYTCLCMCVQSRLLLKKYSQRNLTSSSMSAAHSG